MKNVNKEIASGLSAEQQKKILKKTLIKMSIPIVLCVVVLCFSSVAWFAMNTKTGANGIGLKAPQNPFIIEFPGTDEGKWINNYRTLNHQAGIWLVSDDGNMDNSMNVTEELEGLEPGDSGILQFRVKPTGETESLLVDLCFTLRCIEKPIDQKGVAALPTDQDLVEITNPELLNFVASHIMLFTDIDENGKYTGLLENNNDLERYIRSQTYTKNDTEYTTLYWVWPIHLSNIISTQQSDLVYSINDRETVISYIVKHKEGFFKNITTEDDVLLEDLTAVEHYGSYSILFDKADLDIGNNVQYVILGLSISQTVTSTQSTN